MTEPRKLHRRNPTTVVRGWLFLAMLFVFVRPTVGLGAERAIWTWEADMQRELKLAEKAFRKQPAFAGFAIHHFRSYRKWLDRQRTKH